MKKIFILILLVFSTAAYSQNLTQKQLREQKPFDIGLGISQNGNFSLETLSLDYHIKGNLTIGLNFHRTLRRLGNDFIDNNSLSCIPRQDYNSFLFIGPACDKFENLKKFSSDIYLNYFPFDGIFFISTHLGILPDYGFKVSYDQNVPGILPGNHTNSLSYTAERKNAIFSSFGGGFKWQTLDGFFIKFEFGLLKTIHSEDKVYVYSDERGILPNNYPSSLLDIAFTKAAMFKEPEVITALIHLSVGYSF
ncbi:hypothetical protein V6Z05_19960 [Leptospira venezuelensis]|uniref:hypothetical protein n=1 Tax=Leptospira venezuelensis TaxID=1958811 RepID=UPI0012FFAE6B|nr:hypothetical protein [Leptospira venezuelensis]